MSSRFSHPGFVGQDAQLASIYYRAQALNQVLGIVRGALPPELALLCTGAAWDGTTLLVAVPNSAAAARLRLASPSILVALKDAAVHATAILPRVQVALQQRKPKQASPLAFPDVAKNAFSDLAQTLENNELRQAVLDLLRHQQKRQ